MDAAYLRSLPAEEALIRLKELPGIRDFSAELVLLRGVGRTAGQRTYNVRNGRIARGA
jgi:3-methyladenine DNA glycosylase/8-oxoguanine DNA glycosylase